VLLMWIVYSCGIAFSDSNRQIIGSIQATEDWRTSLSKTRQQIATLPKDHPLRESEDQLRDRTKEFCEQGGQESYDKWKQQTASTFKYKEISTEEREKYNQLLFQLRTLFDANPKAPRPVKGVECALYLNDPNVQPRARPVPRLSAAEWKHMEKETDTMLQNGIIRFSSSDWAAVPVFAKKKDGMLRYAIDLRPLNSCLMTDRLGMGNMDDILNSLGKYNMYSTFDISTGFWGLSVKEQDRKYLAVVDYSLFQKTSP
jgi:hypothetical protein